jgi:hypothetical protein
VRHRMQIGHLRKATTTPAKPERKVHDGPGTRFGYVRVSSTERDLAVQREVLRRPGVDIIFEEQASGTKRDGRTESHWPSGL